MEEQVMETVVNEVSEATTDVVSAEVTDVAVPDGVITEVPVIEDSTSTIGIGKVILGIGIGAAALYGVVKGTKAFVGWVGKKLKKPEKKYARVTDEVTEEYDEMFEDEDLDAETTEEDSIKSEEK